MNIKINENNIGKKFTYTKYPNYHNNLYLS